MAIIKYKVSEKITKKGYPTSDKKYGSAHEIADRQEKKKYPKGYEKMKKVDSSLNKNELSGSHNQAGKIIVSKKVPKKLRKEVAYHESVEWHHDKGKK